MGRRAQASAATIDGAGGADRSGLADDGRRSGPPAPERPSGLGPSGDRHGAGAEAASGSGSYGWGENVDHRCRRHRKHQTCKAMGWDVVRVFKDEGRSGYTGEIRPGFEEMIEFLGTGQADVLIARHHDRLTRNPDDFARLMHVCGKAKIKISLYTGGELDLSTASGGFYGFMETGRSGTSRPFGASA